MSHVDTVVSEHKTLQQALTAIVKSVGDIPSLDTRLAILSSATAATTAASNLASTALEIERIRLDNRPTIPLR